MFRRLYEARFHVRKLVPIDAYGGSDFRSIEADNTSAFNCRRATGSSSWSEHAYGRAIDINPIENPYVENGRVYHDASRSYVSRQPTRKGMAVDGGALVRAFDAIGWGWGGRWSGSVQDYQHFSGERPVISGTLAAAATPLRNGGRELDEAAFDAARRLPGRGRTGRAARARHDG